MKYICASLFYIFSLPTFATQEPFLRPGLYEVRIGIAGNNVTSRQCYKAEQVSTAGAWARTLEDRLWESCKIQADEKSKDVFTWQSICKNSFTTSETIGEVLRSDNGFKAQAKRTMGKVIQEFPMEGKYLGACPG